MLVFNSIPIKKTTINPTKKFKFLKHGYFLIKGVIVYISMPYKNKE